ncbi:flavin-containing monooxygenase [Streptomyces griseoviridis]
MSQPTVPSPARVQPAEADALRARYRAERARRLRPDGAAQYLPPTGAFDADPYADPDFTRAPLTDRVETLIVGGGFGGLLAGARLRQAGAESVRIVERGADFGGTWYWNRYPGVHCDVESYVYLPLLEETGTVPTWKYAPGEEIRRHARAVADRFGLYDRACLQTRVTGLSWDDTESEWTVRTDRDDRIRARHVILATGLFGDARLPGIPGIETFTGHMFHTGRWDHAYTGGEDGGPLTGLAGKRVALVGTGATGVQVAPRLAGAADHLYVFQRTPSSVDVRGNRPTDPGWAASLRPGWQRERQENFARVLAGRPVEEDLVADGWTSTGHLHEKVIPTDRFAHVPPEERERAYEQADFAKMAELRARVDALVDDPVTAELLKPWYPYLCKRPTFSDSYLQMFNRPDVTLVDTAGTRGVERMTETALVVGDTAYEVDCVVLATGYDVVTGALSDTLPIKGRGGVPLRESWAKTGPRTLHGFTTHGFPNLFHQGRLQKAGTANHLHGIDEQSVHIAAIIAEARRRGVRRVEPSEWAQEEWAATLREKAVDLHSFHARCTPGYYNNDGDPPEHHETYADGPLAFHELLRAWRTGGGMEQLLRPE